MVVPYSDASASSPGFTVTDSIFIGRKGWYLETSAGTSDHEVLQVKHKYLVLVLIGSLLIVNGVYIHIGFTKALGLI